MVQYDALTLYVDLTVISRIWNGLGRRENNNYNGLVYIIIGTV